MRDDDEEFVQPFAEFGRALDDAFRRANYAEAAFSELAVEHLSRAHLHEQCTLEALARWTLRTKTMPLQEDIDGRFGEPPITLWRGRRCFVSALVWRTGTTSIHQHAFSGAFQVLDGSSVHAVHRFDLQRAISEDLLLGALRCTEIERLVRGNVRPISRAAEGIHSLFHLDHPSLSLVVRTYRDAQNEMQYSYYPPGLAVWDLRDEPAQRRAAQVARMLARVDRAMAERTLRSALVDMTPFDIFVVLDELRAAGGLTLTLAAFDEARSRLPADLSSAFEAALRERERQQVLLLRRDRIREPALRYLLAILLNARTRPQALALAESYAPRTPGAETLVTWLCELAMVKLKLQASGESWEPNVLGLPDVDAASVEALGRALRGEAVENAGRRPFFDAVRRHSAFEPLFRD